MPRSRRSRSNQGATSLSGLIVGIGGAIAVILIFKLSFIPATGALLIGFLFSETLLSLFCWCLKAVVWVIYILAALPRYLWYLTLRFWQRWTIPPKRFGWRTLRAFPNSETPLLSEINCSHQCRTTSNLCEACYDVVEKSSLVSGSSYLFTKRLEWHGWVIKLQGSELSESKRLCHLCNILWYSIKEQTRKSLPRSTSQECGSDSQVFLWITIWRDNSKAWFDDGIYYLQVFETPESGRQLCRAIEIRQEKLQGQPTSVHIPISTASTDSIELIKSWIAECEIKHSAHCLFHIWKDSRSYVPTRLLYVGDNMSSVLRLEETTFSQSTAVDTKYITLSHCWGDNCISASHKLTMEKKAEWKTYIDEKTLPLTFQHAIHLTRQLGLHYLWIDTLCIIQDSPGDLKLGSTQMGHVYANSHCTISTCGFVDGNGGFFRERTSCLLDFPCYLRFSKDKAMTVRAHRNTYDSKAFSVEVDRSPLGRRAWSLQERLLSRRTIHFGSRFIFFECNTHIASEVAKCGLPYREKQTFYRMMIALLPGFRKSGTRLDKAAFASTFNPVTGYRACFDELRLNRATTLPSKEEIRLHKCWFELVSKFARGRVKEPLDRVEAILGLAQAIHDGDSDLEYKHGLWQRHLLFDLLWYIESGHAEKPTGHHAPSWSWQAVDGQVGQRLISFEKVAVGQKSDLIKVAEVVANGLADHTAHEIEPLLEQALILKCPILCCSKLISLQGQVFALEVQMPEGRVEARFVPDLLDFQQSGELFCAEIIREVIYKTTKNREISMVWSNGIVLRRNLSTRSKSEDVKVMYERVGRFWMEWPVAKEGNTIPPSDTKRMLSRKNGHIIRII